MGAQPMSRRRVLALAAAFTAAAVARPRNAAGQSNAAGPSHQWTRRPRPGPHGFGLSKHTRWAQDPGTGLWWISGGDYSVGDGRGESGRQEVRVFDPVKYRMEVASSYAAPAGEVNASGPDETGWAFDEGRRLCWLVPGYMWKRDIPGAVYNRVMTFDVESRKWADVAPIYTEGGKSSSYSGTIRGRFSSHDAATDTLYHPYLAPSGLAMAKFRCGAMKWERQGQATLSAGSRPLRMLNLGKDYHAFDEKRRRLVFLDLQTRNLAFYELDAQRWSTRATTHVPPPRVSNTYAFVWDGDADAYVRFSGRVNDDPANPWSVGHRGSPRTDLWAIPADGDTWREIELSGDRPPETDMGILLWDRVRHHLMLIGGPQKVNDGSIHYLRLDPLAARASIESARHG